MSEREVRARIEHYEKVNEKGLVELFELVLHIINLHKRIEEEDCVA